MAKYASIDIGSNTLLLLIVDDSSGELLSIVDECHFGRLSQGLATSKRLHPDAIARSLEIVSNFRSIMDQHEIANTRCVGTQALRESENRAEFVVPAQELLGCPIEIIAGEREAALVAGAVRHSFPELCAQEMVSVDVGGASTEFIVFSQGTVKSVRSLPIGAVRLSEAHLQSDPPSPEQVDALFGSIDSALETLDLPMGAPLVGTAGTATSIASIRLQLPSYDAEQVHGLQLSPSQVEQTLLSLLEMPLDKKRSLAGLEPKRADVIAGGVAIYARVLERMGSPRFHISDRGVRWGLAYEAAGQSVTG